MDFWGSLDNLVLSHKLVIDRPRARTEEGLKILKALHPTPS